MCCQGALPKTAQGWAACLLQHLSAPSCRPTAKQAASATYTLSSEFQAELNISWYCHEGPANSSSMLSMFQGSNLGKHIQ